MNETLTQTVERWAWDRSPEEAAREIWKDKLLAPEQFYAEMKKQGYKKRDVTSVKVWVEKMRKEPLLRIDPWEEIDCG